jgi:hypothetical protein
MKQQLKMSSKETKMNSCTRDNCLREIEEDAQKGLRRTALLGSQIPLKSHRQSARRAKDFRRRFVVIRLSGDRLLFGRSVRLSAKAVLQGSQLATDSSTKETVIADLDKSMRENMLKETLKKLLNRKPALFELTGIGNAVLKGNLRSFQGAAVIKRKQASITDGNAMDIGCTVL